MSDNADILRSIRDELRRLPDAFVDRLRSARTAGLSPQDTVGGEPKAPRQRKEKEEEPQAPERPWHDPRSQTGSQIAAYENLGSALGRFVPALGELSNFSRSIREIVDAFSKLDQKENAAQGPSAVFREHASRVYDELAAPKPPEVPEPPEVGPQLPSGSGSPELPWGSQKHIQAELGRTGELPHYVEPGSPIAREALKGYEGPVAPVIDAPPPFAPNIRALEATQKERPRPAPPESVPPPVPTAPQTRLELPELEVPTTRLEPPPTPAPPMRFEPPAPETRLELPEPPRTPAVKEEEWGADYPAPPWMRGPEQSPLPAAPGNNMAEALREALAQQGGAAATVAEDRDVAAKLDELVSLTRQLLETKKSGEESADADETERGENWKARGIGGEAGGGEIGDALRGLPHQDSPRPDHQGRAGGGGKSFIGSVLKEFIVKSLMSGV